MFPASVPVHAAAALTVTVTASVTSQIRIQGLYRATKSPELTPFSRNVAHSAGDRTSETTTIASNVQGDVVALSVDAVTAGIKRGTVYVVVQLASYAVTLTVARGYVYEGVPLVLGQFIEPGPGGGEGFLSWVTLFANRAGDAAAAGFVLTAANTIRKIHKIVHYYNADATVATRTFARGYLRLPGGTLPTGFAGGDTTIWSNIGADVTLTASEEGMLYADALGMASNDSETPTKESQATNWSPLPLLLLEGDVTEYTTRAVTNGVATDVQSAYTFIEEWLAPP